MVITNSNNNNNEFIIILRGDGDIVVVIVAVVIIFMQSMDCYNYFGYIIINLKQTMFLACIVLQLFCSYNL